MSAHLQRGRGGICGGVNGQTGPETGENTFNRKFCESTQAGRGSPTARAAGCLVMPRVHHTNNMVRLPLVVNIWTVAGFSQLGL